MAFFNGNGNVGLLSLERPIDLTVLSFIKLVSLNLFERKMKQHTSLRINRKFHNIIKYFKMDCNLKKWSEKLQQKLQQQHHKINIADSMQ